MARIVSNQHALGGEVSKVSQVVDKGDAFEECVFGPQGEIVFFTTRQLTESLPYPLFTEFPV